MTIWGRRSGSGARPCSRTVSTTHQGWPARRPAGDEESRAVAEPPAWATAGAVRRRSGRISRQRRIGSVLVSTGTRLPPHVVALHHSPPLSQRPGLRQRAREAAERLLVVGREDEQALAARAHR